MHPYRVNIYYCSERDQGFCVPAGNPVSLSRLKQVTGTLKPVRIGTFTDGEVPSIKLDTNDWKWAWFTEEYYGDDSLKPTNPPRWFWNMCMNADL